MPVRDKLTQRLTTLAARDHVGDIPCLRREVSVPYIPPELVDTIFGHLHPVSASTPPFDPVHARVPVMARRQHGRKSRRRMAMSKYGDEDDEDGVEHSLALPGSLRKQDLMSCSLVCRCWRSLARPHLFYDVAFVIRQRRNGYQSTKSFADYHNLVAPPSEIAPCIHHLRLEVPDQYANAEAGHLQVKLDASALRDFLHCLPRLQSLRLLNVQLSGPALPPLAGSTPPLTLRSLQIGYRKSNQPYPVPDIEYTLLLGLFSHIQELYVTGLGIPGDETSIVDYDGLPPLGLIRLIVERTCNGPILAQCLQKALHPVEVQLLSIRLPERPEELEDSLREAAVLESIGRRTHELAISYGGISAHGPGEWDQLEVLVCIADVCAGIRRRDLYRRPGFVPCPSQANSGP